LEVFGRLRDGVSLAQARSEFRTISQILSKQYPDTNKDLVASLKPYAEEYVGTETRATIYTMFAAVFLVLLIACANVANLTLVRMTGRSREFAIRSALGAGRWRLLLQVFAECILICAVASVVATILAVESTKYTIEMLRANPDMTPPFWVRAEVDWRIVLFSIGMAVFSAIMSGLLPALRTTRMDLKTALHQGGFGMAQPLGRTSRILVTAQITLSFVLLISAGLMTRSVLNLNHVKVGANVSNVLTGRIGLMESKYPDPSAENHFYDQLFQKLSSLSGARAATLTTSLPGTFSGHNFFVTDSMPADQQRLPLTYEIVIAPNYFHFFEVPLLSGRFFDSRDHKDSLKVAIVNQMLAEKFWPHESAIGRRLRLGEKQDQGDWLTVVGVVRNDEKMFPGVYVPLAQTEARFMSLAVRTRSNPSQLQENLRKAVEEVDPDLPVYWVRDLKQWIELNRFDTNFLATLFGIFAVVAIILAAAGQYAVLSYTVGQRTREIGIRRALGAFDQAILKLFLNQGLRQFATALIVGLPLALVFGRLISRELYGVTAFDPITLVVVPLSLFAVSLCAAVAPTRRALHVDPAISLRTE
jgi:putative ABC transport system permease protein